MSAGLVTDSSWQCRVDKESEEPWEPAKIATYNWLHPEGVSANANWIWVTSDGTPPSGVTFEYNVTCTTCYGKQLIHLNL